MADIPDITVTVAPAAKAWYQSKAVIASVAGIVMAVAPKLLKLVGLDIPISQDQANEIALFVIPQAVALWGRISATTVVAGSAAKAADINASQARIAANIEALK